MSLKKYDSFCKTGIKTIPSKPLNWKSIRIKDIISKVGSGVTPKGGSEVYVMDGIPLLRSQNVYDDGLRIGNVSHIDIETNAKMKNSEIQPYDILINLTGASIGRTCTVPSTLKKANINQHIIYLRIKKKKVDFLSYYLKSQTIKDYIMMIQEGTSKEALNMSQTLSIPVILPNYNEQTQIAAYLDKKTSAIDKKIALLEKKAKLYQELRKNLINETVCRGLDKNVKLKDSGVEWIGMIPEHWEVKRFKSFAKTIKGKNLLTSDVKFPESLPLLSLEYLRNSKVTFNTYCFSSDKSLKSTKDDLIIVWDGAAVGEILNSKIGYISSTIAKIDFNKKKILPKFFFFLKGNIDYMLKSIPTGMGIPHLNPHILNNYPCPKPPLNEQLIISRFLDKKTSIIDKIDKSIKTQIETLKELRKTLINDVVTDKVKVID